LLNNIAFILVYIVNNNRLNIKAFSLIDIKANKYIFINIKFIKLVKYFLDI